MLVDEATGKERWAVQAHAGTHADTHVVMSPSGRFVASVGFDEENWKLWDAADGAEWVARRNGRNWTMEVVSLLLLTSDDNRHIVFLQFFGKDTM